MVSLEADLRELQRVRRLQMALAGPAGRYEEVARECKGECDEPRLLGPLLTCCACKAIHDVVVDASRLEKIVRQRIERCTPEVLPRVNFKREMLGSLELRRKVPRKHSPTFAGRMKGEAAEKLRRLREQFKELDEKKTP